MHRLMISGLFLALIAALAVSFIVIWKISCNEVQENHQNTLVLLHVLFRHGERTPDLSEVYPNDPHAHDGFAPLGYGQLTKAGKRREYLIGTALRKRYNQFLGLYQPDAVFAKSTDFVRTRMSCLLVLAGLFPPSAEQLWEDSILWQPITYDYVEHNKDKIIGFPTIHCPAFKQFYQQYLSSPEGSEFYKNNTEVFDYLSKNTGWKVKTPRRVLELYCLLNSEELLGLQLPDWTKRVWPKTLSNLGVIMYDVLTSSDKMLRIAVGHFIEKLLNDTDLKLQNKLSNATKIFLYSAHEFNIAFLLKALGLFKPHVPSFGAYLTFEIHKTDGIYGLKILYQNYESSEPMVLKLDQCDEICPIEHFKQLVRKYTPVPGDCDI